MRHVVLNADLWQTALERVLGGKIVGMRVRYNDAGRNSEESLKITQSTTEGFERFQRLQIPNMLADVRIPAFGNGNAVFQMCPDCNEVVA